MVRRVLEVLGPKYGDAIMDRDTYLILPHITGPREKRRSIRYPRPPGDSEKSSESAHSASEIAYRVNAQKPNWRMPVRTSMRSGSGGRAISAHSPPLLSAPPRGFGRTTLASQRPPGSSGDAASAIRRARASASGSYVQTTMPWWGSPFLWSFLKSSRFWP